MHAHFKGASIVKNGAWHMDVPLDFLFYVNPKEETPYLNEKAIKTLAYVLTENHVAAQEAACYTEEEDVY